MNDRIWLSSPHMGGNEIKYIQEAFDTNWIAPLGPHVDQFEEDLSAYTKVAHSAVLSSGTAAIHLALILLGVKSGDEVLCQSFTFSATANPILYQHAIPIFVDSEADTWNMDPAQLEIAIADRIKVTGKKPKAIIPVHLYGMPAKMTEILSIAEKYEVAVVEDAAEALGSSLKGKKCGNFGCLSVLSFNGNKIITTSGGGALLSNDEVSIEKARFLATQARDSAPHYQHSEIGYNYRMSNIAAGIGRGQLEVLQDRVDSRRKNFEFYKEHLGRLSNIEFLEELQYSYSNRWLTCILTESFLIREKIRLALEAENIEARPLWKPMHIQPIFESYPSYTNGTSEALFERGLCLPSGSTLVKLELVRVITGIKKVLMS